MIDRIGAIILKAILTELTLSPALLIYFHVNFNNNRKDPLRLLSILYSTGQKKPNRERCAERVLKAFCFAFPERSLSVPLAFP